MYLTYQEMGGAPLENKKTPFLAFLRESIFLKSGSGQIFANQVCLCFYSQKKRLEKISISLICHISISFLPIPCRYKTLQSVTRWNLRVSKSGIQICSGTSHPPPAFISIIRYFPRRKMVIHPSLQIQNQVLGHVDGASPNRTNSSKNRQGKLSLEPNNHVHPGNGIR